MKTLYTTYNNFAKRLAMLFILLAAIGIENGYAAQETLSGSFTSSNTTSGGFTASGGTAGKYYKLQTGYIISDNSYSVDATKSISISMKVGTFGNYSADKQSVDFYAIDKNGNIISNKVTASFSKANSDGTTFSGTIKLNSGISGNEVRFKFASNSNATSSVCARFYNFTITYESAPSTFTVTYNANGAESGDVPTDPNEYASGVAVTVLGNTGDLVKTGYRFDGWQIDKAGTVYNAGDEFNISANTTLYAKWTERRLTNYRTSCGSAATLVSIAVNGQTTTYNVGDSFSFDGTCTATYNDESTKTVTPTSVSSPNMSTAGTKTVTVTYTENDVTVTTTYEIVVNVVKTATSLTWSADSYTATIASPSNLFPTLTINPEAIKGSVTYSSSHPEYATIDATGNIRLLAAGTTTITASYAGDEDYAEASDTYELTVEESTNCRWEEVTNLNDIATGDEVVITMSKGNFVWTISNEKHTSSTAPTTVDISANVEGQYLTTVNDGNKWVIEKNNDNLTFYSYTDQANYLYCTNDDNGVRVGTGTAEVFVVDGNYLKNIETTSPRYLGVSLNTEPYSWRCYTVTTSVIKDQTLKFYKKVCLPSNVSRVTYSVGEGDTAPAEQEVENNTSITLPSITTNLTCVNFVGWTDAASGYTHGTDKLYKAGDSYTVTENVTLHAVYAAGGGYVLVTDEANLAVGDKVIIVATNSNVAMGADRGNNRGQVEVTKDGNTISNIGESQILTLEAGTKSETFAFNTGSGYLYAASSGSNYLKTQATNNDNGSWKIEIDNVGVATIKAQGTYTRNWLRYNDGSDIFSCYASGQSDVSIYKEDVAGYTTDPECVTYSVSACDNLTNGTITIEKITVDPYGSTTVTFTPADGYMLQAVTVTSGTATVGSPSYTTSQISGGTVRITDIQSDIEVCATFVEIPYYKVTFVDMNNGNSTQEVSQSGFGADITAPTTASDGCDATWTFIGWAPNNSLTGATEEPDGLVAPGGTISGSQITSNDLTYYSVYSNSSDGTPPFSIGKSGTYFMYALSGSTKYYATTAKSNGTSFYANTEADFAQYGNPSTFTLSYNSTNGTYKIKHRNTTAGKESEGYFYQADPTENDITINSETNYTNFIITAGNAAGSNRITFTYNSKTGNFGYSSGFQGYAAGYDIYFEPASEMRYYNASSCTELVTITFDVPADAELTYENGYPEGYYKDSEKKNVSTFPTLTYEGWTFIGWTAGASYNDQIGDANLDDENSSPNAPSATIYKTGGETYYLGADVTMYPVFTRFPDNEPFDIINGGDYYIYYIADGDVATSEDEYGATNRIYAGGWQSGGTSESYGSTQSCANATLFTFTKLSNGKWTIYDNTKGKYLCAGSTDNNLALNATTATYGEWTIEVHNGNQVNAVSKDQYTLSALSQDAVTGTFKNYATSNFNNNSAYYHRVYVGTCTERVYSSNPSNKPKITLNGTATVTSTKDQSIRSAKSLSLSAVKLAANGTITLTSDNADVYFSTDKTANFSKGTKPVASLTINADANGKLTLTTVYVHYKPAAVPTSNLDIQTVTITATTGTEGQPDYATATTTASVRNLPAKFVIATKVGANWYALPANMSGATNPEGVLIEVDETTMTATAPNTTSYTLFPVKTTNSSGDRYEEYGDRVRFSAVNNESKGLWTSSTESTIRNYAVIDEVTDGSSDDSYEWKITTTVVDGNWQYTLQTDQEKNQKYLRYWTGATGSPKWGTYAAGNDQLYFLPVTETEPFDYQVVEWYPTKMLIQTDAAISNPTAKIGDATINNVTCTNKGGKLYEIAGLPLANNPTKVLTIKFSNYTNTKVIPVIISRSETTISSEPFKTLTKDVYNYSDLVVRDGATLTIDGGTLAENTFFNVTIYPTSKISVPEGKKITVHSLTFFGGIDEIYNGSNYTLNKYGVPELSLKGSLKKSISTIAYLMRVDSKQMYSLTVPYDVQLADIKYWDGTNIVLGDELWVSAYDGESRAKKSKKNWIYETDFESKLGAATLKAGVGYTISAEMQAGVGNEYSILRMPMTSNVANEGTEAAKSVAVTAHGIDTEVSDNHKGWNLVGNPYMTSITGADDTDLVLGYLKETGTGPWEWVENTYRYVTIPSDDGTYYWQQKFTDAVLPPFKNFFVQVGTTGELVFDLGTRQSMPARSTQAAIEKEVEFEILISNDARQDNTGLLISEEYSPAYEINADLEKMIGSMSVYTIYGGYKLAYNALSPINASEWIPMGYIAPTAGEYTFRIDDVDKVIDQIAHIYLIDYTTNTVTDLMVDEYQFATLVGTNDTRFAINVILNSRDNTATGLGNIKGDDDQPIKFIYQDKMYIHNNGIIYDATGKQVTTINK